jgi:hypothetical protein
MANPFETALEQSAAMVTTMTAQVTGMTQQEVAAILADSLPKALDTAKLDPQSASEAFRDAFETVPESLSSVYEKLGAAAAAQGATVEDFRAMFGASATNLAETATTTAGATRDQVDSVIGAALPALKDAMRTGADTAGAAVASLDPAKAQEMLGQASQAAASVFGRLAGRS